ncbi:MAG: LOG family protein [Phycisphaerae bacterium]|jgi:hypothetical protein
MQDQVATVFGAGRADPESTLYRLAYDVGRTVASCGWTLCTGGYGGTMEAASRGAFEAGGHTIGVTCEAFGRAGPNPFVRAEVPTPDLFTRLATLMRLGLVYVVLPGGTGTLLELAAVWEFTNKGLTAARPIVLAGEFWAPLERLVRAAQPDACALLTIPDAQALRGLLLSLAQTSVAR